MVEYTEFLRQTNSTTGGSTFNQVEVKCPTVQMPQLRTMYGKSGKAIALAVHKIEFEFPRVALADGEYLEAQITRTSKAGEVGVEDPDCLAKGLIHNDVITSGGGNRPLIIERSFYPPLLIASQTLYFGVIGSVTGKHNVRIHYTLRETDLAGFVNALVPDN